MRSCRTLNGKHLVFPHENPAQLMAVFPQAKVAPINGVHYGAVDNTMENAQILSNMGYTVQSPIRTQYNWPGRYTPFPHQIDTAELCTLNKRCFVLNSMRTGKTAATLWAADYLMKLGLVRRVLILAPLSTLSDVWADELFFSFHHRTHAVIYGTAQKRKDLLKRDHDFYILNHDGLGVVQDDLGIAKAVKHAVSTRPDIDLVIMDECFPAGTKVLTSTGERCIETIQLGDTIVTSQGLQPVTHLFTKISARLVTLHFEDGTNVTCTPEHPFATDHGWVKAEDTAGKRSLQAADLPPLWNKVFLQDQTSEVLQQIVHDRECVPHEDVPLLWKGFQDQEGGCKLCPCEVLQQELFGESAASRGRNLRSEVVQGVRCALQNAQGDGKLQAGVNVRTILCKKTCVVGAPGYDDGRYGKSYREEARTTCCEQRCTHVSRSIGEPKSFQDPEDAGTVSKCQKGKRHRHGTNGTTHIIGSARQFSIQLSNKDQDGKRQWISNLLQSGFWGPAYQNSCGGRRSEPQQPNQEVTGQEKRFISLGVRVVSVTHHEPPGEGIPVWNLEVAGPQDYIANGKVVHNCAVFRNAKTDRWKLLKRLVRPEMWVWGLTGTPTPNTYTDAYAQMKLIKPENYPGSFTDFRSLVMMPAGGGPFTKWIPRRHVSTVINGVHCHSPEEIVNQILKPSIRIPRSVCSAREPIITSRYAELSPTQKKHYEELRKECITTIDGTQITAINAAVLAMRLTQVALGGSYDADSEWVGVDFGPRLSLIEDLIEQNDAKVLVFVPFTGALNAFAKEIGKRWPVAVIDGSVSKNKRDKIFYEFRNSDTPHVIVAHPKTMAHGLDLTAASAIIWAAPFYDNELYQQANARLDGVKQTKQVDIVRVYGTKLEQSIYAVLDGKESIQQAILDLARGK